MTGSKELELVIATLDREFGQGTVVRLGTTNIEPWPAISTGALTLDLALGIGGLPKGRVVEIAGMESAGKTTVALNVIAQAQAEGGTCVFVDVEHALDPVYAQALGVNLDDLLLSQPDYGEAALEVVDRLVRTGEIAVVVVDSVAALVPKAELEGSMGDSHMGLQPRLMSQAMRKLVAKAHETNTLVIFTNQIREKIGVVYGNPEITTGGRALKFYSSIRIDLRRVSDIKDSRDGLVRGIRTKAKIIKNKLAPALRIAEFDIIYGRGIDVMGCLLDAALSKEIFVQKGAWLYYNGESFANGRVKAIEALASDLDFADLIRKQVKEDVRA